MLTWKCICSRVTAMFRAKESGNWGPTTKILILSRLGDTTHRSETRGPGPHGARLARLGQATKVDELCASCALPALGHTTLEQAAATCHCQPSSATIPRRARTDDIYVFSQFDNVAAFCSSAPEVAEAKMASS